MLSITATSDQEFSFNLNFPDQTSVISSWFEKVAELNNYNDYFIRNYFGFISF